MFALILLEKSIIHLFVFRHTLLIKLTSTTINNILGQIIETRKRVIFVLIHLEKCIIHLFIFGHTLLIYLYQNKQDTRIDYRNNNKQ